MTQSKMLDMRMHSGAISTHPASMMGALEQPEFRGKPSMINANQYRPAVYVIEVRLVVLEPYRGFKWALKWQRLIALRKH